jgi:SAM-dependent methyltransferase
MTDLGLVGHWDAAYAGGDRDRSWTEDEPSDSLDAIRCAGATLEAPVIDVGGGSSRLTASLLAAGHTDLTVLDISGAALELARGRLGPAADAVEWIVADLLAWQPRRQYAIWHDRAVLHFFTDTGDRRRYGETAHSALAPGGHAIIATFAPGGPERCSGLPVCRSSADDILDVLGGGFVAVHASLREHRTPSGTRQPFTWIIAKRTH